MTRMMKNTGRRFYRVLNAMRAFYVACSRRQKLILGVFSLVGCTTTVYASSALNTTAGVSILDIAPAVNLLLTTGILCYAIRLEHRLTKLETLQEVIAKQLKLMDE